MTLPNTPLHIALDGNEANITNRVGSNVYAFEIITQIEKILQKNTHIKVTVLLSSEKISELPPAREGWSYVVVTPQAFWTQWALPIHLFLHKNNYDVFFTPGHYAPRICPIPYVSCVMDTAYLVHPEHFKKSDVLKLSNWTHYSVKNARKVIAISQFTKDEVIKYYHKNPEEVIVAYPAVDEVQKRFDQRNVQKFFKKHKITKPYFLFVGTLQPRKNITTLIEAFEIYYRMQAGRSLQKKYKVQKLNLETKPKLVIAGKIGWLSEPILEKIKNSSLKNKIVLTGFITELEKQMLYQHANASCLIGLYEGFGIPPLESLQHETIPIVSNTSSLPEVVGDAGLLVDPLNPQAVADQLWSAQHITTLEKRAFKKKAQTQVKKFSWQQSAETILTTIISSAQQP